MARTIEPRHHVTLDDYAGVAHLAPAVQELRDQAASVRPQLEGRTVWMVNSTEKGGGVAEMLPGMVALLRELGVDVRWMVMEGPPEFFAFTKRVHNLVHGADEPAPTAADRALYDDVSAREAEALAAVLGPRDLLAVHDPQPLGMGALASEAAGVPAVWRCHIGLDERNAATDAAWSFLEPYACRYRRAVFTAPEYIPPGLAGRSTIIHPALDPLSHKNRDLPIHKLIGVLCDAGLMEAQGPLLSPPFPDPARRLQPDGSWRPATEPEDPGLLFHPLVTQVSRWDRLKGFAPLLRGFARLKAEANGEGEMDERARRAIRAVRLVLAGPDPDSVQDDPEAVAVLDELRDAYVALAPDLQREVVLLSLPMASAKYNALMVNALQRCSSVVVQNSLREGFGLTATEAMWKHVALMGTCAAGLRQQIRDGLDGRLVEDPEDPEELAATLRELLADEHLRDRLARSAQHRVHREFLVFTQLRRWLEVLSAMV
jgi:trehalose synthase